MKVPPFTLVQLHYFAAAVEYGSMTAAARELMVSQSAISTAIAQLEKALGVTLVLRHHAHGLALTEAGRAFHSELRAFLAHLRSDPKFRNRDAAEILARYRAIPQFRFVNPGMAFCSSTMPGGCLPGWRRCRR